MNEEADRLATNYLPLARKIARFWSGHHPDMAADLQSAAAYALVKASRTYDGRIMFSNYAAVCIRNELQDLMRKTRLRRVRFQEHAARMLARRAQPEDPAKIVERADLCARLLAVPKGKRAVVARVLYAEGGSTADAADRIGRDRRHAIYVAREAAREIREFADDAGLTEGT